MNAGNDKIESKRPLVIIGTSGSTDYLKDTTGNRRYWPVASPPADMPPLSAEDRAVVQRLVGPVPVLTVAPGPAGRSRRIPR